MKTSLVCIWILFAGISFGQKSERFLTAKAFYLNNQYKEAEKLLVKEYKENPSIGVTFLLASTYYEQQKYKQSIPLYHRLYQTGDTNIQKDCIPYLCASYDRLKQKDSAYYFANLGIEQFPKEGVNYTNKAFLLRADMKFSEAKEVFYQCYKMDTTKYERLQNYIDICYKTKDYDECLRGLFLMRTLHPEYAIEMNFGYCYSMMENYKAADSVYQIVNKMDDPLFLNNFGFNKFKLGEKEKGIELIQQSLKLMPDNSYAYRNLAIIALEEGDKKKACMYLNKAKKLNFQMKYGDEVNTLLLEHCQ